MKGVINVKDLRASLPEIVKRVQRGDQYTVFYMHPCPARCYPVTFLLTRPVIMCTNTHHG